MGKWKMVRLSDIVDKAITGEWGTECSDGKKGTKVLRTTNFTNLGVINYDNVVLRDIPLSKVDTKRLKKHDIILEKSGGSDNQPVGRVVYFDNDSNDVYLCNNFTQVLRIKQNIACPKYLFLYLFHLHQNGTTKLLQNKTTGIRNLQVKRYMALEIPLPLLPVQQQIADVLDRASALIEKRKAQIDKLDLLIKSQFIEMFGDPVRNPMGWEVRKLGEIICDGPQNGLYKPANLYTTDGTGTPILRIDAFYDGKITDIKALKRLICTPKEIERYSLRENDVVINRVNSIEYLGKCAHVTGLFERTVFESNMMRFSINPNILNALYTVTLLCSPYVYNQITRHAKKAVNQASINQSDVQDFDVLVPPLELQNKFAAFVERVEEQKAQIKKSLDLLELCYKSLMWKCFSREVFQ